MRYFLLAGLVLSLFCFAKQGAALSSLPESNEPSPPGTILPSEKDSLPVFGGLFGPRSLLERTGFRAAEGTFIEYDFFPNQTTSITTIRYACIAVNALNQKWIEMTETTVEGRRRGLLVQVSSNGLSILKVRLWVDLGNSPFAIDVTPDRIEALIESGVLGVSTKPLSLFSPVEVGESRQERINGVDYQLTQYRVAPIEAKGAPVHEYWISATLPFNGAAKILSPMGIMRVSRIGTDAKGRIPLPED